MYLLFNNSSSLILNMKIYIFDLYVLIIMMIKIMMFHMLLMMNSNFYMFKNKNMMKNIEFKYMFILIMIIFLKTYLLVKLLYNIDETLNPEISIKLVGNQWFWSYEYYLYKNITMHSLIINNMLNFQYLESSNNIIIPSLTMIRMICTSMDVIHSWNLMSLGMKMDAIPGQLTQFLILLNFNGLYFGQCMEICGMNHSMMPISLESFPILFLMKY